MTNSTDKSPSTRSKTPKEILRDNLKQLSEITTHRDKLAGILFQYGNLYERWSEDRESFTTIGQDLSDRLEEVESVLVDLKAIEASLMTTMEHEVKKRMEPLTDKISEHVFMSVYREIEAVKKSVKNLSRDLRNNSQTLSQDFQGIVANISRYYHNLDRREREYDKEAVKYFSFSTLACVGISVLASLITAWMVR